MHSFNVTVHFSDVKFVAIQFCQRSFFQCISKQGSELKKTNGRVINSVVGSS